MSKLKEVSPTNLIIGMIYNKSKIEPNSVIDKLINSYGEIDMVSEEFNFFELSGTDYYTQEMGKNLYRKFVSFKELISPDELVKIKLSTISLEEELAEAALRRVNLDPGYISYNNLILVSTKPAPHRIYLSAGIWAELTLVFSNKKFTALPWTYRDYRSKEYIDFFDKVRKKYKEKMLYVLTK